MHSRRLSEPPLTPWAILTPSGQVCSAPCTCMAGVAESCTHEKATVTDEPAYWMLPSSIGKVHPENTVRNFETLFCPIRSLQSLANVRGTSLDRSDLSALQKHCQTIRIIADVSEEQAVQIERRTWGQHTSSLWFAARAGRITASSLHSVYATDISSLARSTIKRVCYPTLGPGTATTSCDDRNFCLHVVDGQVHLKKNHQYYSQARLQKAQEFFLKVALPELMVQYFTIPPTSQASFGPSVLRQQQPLEVYVKRPRKQPAKKDKAPMRNKSVWCLCAGPEKV
ncbi:unnamed protein product [Leuciscus chuanchicus]